MAEERGDVPCMAHAETIYRRSPLALANGGAEPKRLVVLGGGESGVGAAVLGRKLGMDVWLSDSGSLRDDHRRELEERGIAYEDRGHTMERVLQADMVVKSPGIPPSAPVLRAVMQRGIPVVSEIEFAGRHMPAGTRTVCVTGSNGKTTTTLLTCHVLQGAGLDASPAGNVGRSLARQVAEEPHQVYVIELSSFQLENMYDFRADIAVLLNITPDHMDRYDHEMACYAAAKLRIVRNQRPGDSLIYWAGDSLVADGVAEAHSKAMKLPFAELEAPGLAAWTDGGELRFAVPGRQAWQMARTDLSLPGLHNLYNSMAAGLAATALGVAPKDVARGLSTFKAVEHRLEHVADIDGVEWINDSKATNVDSTWYALESMTRPTVLILGGKDKGNDYTAIDGLVRQKVKAIVCMGVDNSKLLRHFGGRGLTVADTHSVQEAVAECARLAAEGDTVLLSPCCASFDLFKSYEDRGRRFKDCVKALQH